MCEQVVMLRLFNTVRTAPHQRPGGGGIGHHNGEIGMHAKQYHHHREPLEYSWLGEPREYSLLGKREVDGYVFIGDVRARPPE